MAVYYMGMYDITDPDRFQRYPEIVMELLPKYQGELLAVDTAPFVVEGTPRTMNTIVRFPSREMALGLYNDPAYAPAKEMRHASTRNCTMVLVEEFEG